MPALCVRLCVHKASADPTIPKIVTEPTAAEKAEQQATGIKLEDPGRDWSQSQGVKLGKGRRKHATTEVFPDDAGPGGCTTETTFNCYVEGYEPTPKEGAFLQHIINPQAEYLPNGRDDALTHFFYEKALKGEPEALLVALFNCEGLLERKSDSQIAMSELNELKVDRLLAMVADMPVEIDLATKIDAWHIVLEADWLHWAERDGATERAIIRLAEQDAAFLPQLWHTVTELVVMKLKLLREQTSSDSKISLDAIDSHDSDIMNYISSHYPEAKVTWNSLIVLRKAQQTVANCMPQKAR